MPLASVILGNYNGAGIADTLRASVAAVLAQTWVDLELILVDDGSTDDSPSLLAGLAAADPRAQFASTGRHRGIPAVRNVGLARARGAYLAFLDNDAVPAPDWLAILVSRLASDPTAGACASRVMFADRPDLVNSVGSVLNRLAHGTGVGMHELYEFLTLPDEIMYATGNGMALRRAALAGAGPFDEGFRFYGHDDSDMGVRLRAAGYRLVPEPRAVVLHLHSYSKTQPGIRFWDDRNRLRFALKHYHWRELAWFAAADAWQRLRYPGRLGYLRAWLSNARDLAPLAAYRRAHRGLGPFLARQAPFMQGTHAYLVAPDNRGLGTGFPPLQRLEAGRGDEGYLYHGWYWPQDLPGRRGAVRWGRRVASLAFSLPRGAEGLELELLTPPGSSGGSLAARLRRQDGAEWLETGQARWPLAPTPLTRQRLAWPVSLETGDYRLILIAERAHREPGDFPRELGLGLVTLGVL